MQIDLGGIAKGYALDLAGAALLRTGATTGLVDIGGDVLVLGPRPGNQPWRVGVRHPLGQRENVYKVLKLTSGAVATSGNQERFSTIEGRRFSHIVDPRSGRPAEQAPSVTVIAPAGITADAWATALSVLSVAEGQVLLATPNAPDLEVLWLEVRDGTIHSTQTAGFDAYLADE